MTDWEKITTPMLRFRVRYVMEGEEMEDILLRRVEPTIEDARASIQLEWIPLIEVKEVVPE